MKESDKRKKGQTEELRSDEKDSKSGSDKLMKMKVRRMTRMKESDKLNKGQTKELITGSDKLLKVRRKTRLKENEQKKNKLEVKDKVGISKNVNLVLESDLDYDFRFESKWKLSGAKSWSGFVV